MSFPILFCSLMNPALLNSVLFFYKEISSLLCCPALLNSVLFFKKKFWVSCAAPVCGRKNFISKLGGLLSVQGYQVGQSTQID